MTKRSWLVAVCVAILLVGLSAASASAQSGPVALQGKLDGVGDGERDFTLTIWDAATGGQAVATAEGTALVRSGLFTLLVNLPASAFDGASRWWSVAVDGQELPRQRVVYTPMALRAGNLHIRAGSPITTGLLSAFPPEGEILEGEWGVYLVGSNDDTRRLRLGVSNNGITKADISLFNNNDRYGWIAFSTSRNNGAPSEQRLGINQYGRVRIGEFPGSYSDGLLVVDKTDSRLEGFGLRVRNSVDANGLWVQALGSGSGTPLAVDGAGGIRLFTVHDGGRTDVRTLRILGGSDLAEPFPASPAQPVTPRAGMVLSIDPAHPGALRVSTEAYDTRVAGVYSGGNGLNTGMLMGQDGCDLTADGDGRLPLAMTGRVWVYADDSNGPITPGDRLTTSGINAGYAARVADETRSIGAVIGKAMTAIDPTTGMVLVLVNLQ
ncbi:MAG: hypothetical protein KIT54_07645 [Phycisphaeraceae bacterium]|nr:hypothetical protein [Phycisphaeraceae bacterium]